MNQLKTKDNHTTQQPDRIIKVAMVEDDPGTLACFGQLFQAFDQFEWTGGYSSGEQALQLVPRNPPDVVFMDIRMKGMSGIECTRRLRIALPDLGIIMLTAYLEKPLILESLMAGAAGFIQKPGSTDEFKRAARLVAGGGVALSEAAITELVFSLRKSKPLAHPALSSREQEIMSHLIQGKSDKEIAAAISTELSTVQSHMRHIQAKLGVHSRAAAVSKFFGLE
ncbi:MAG: response regulator transcription factor [Verrucomicrobia bacterium]|nr:response regulator transcription factor [Verrucomicrobiota bacterium]